MGANIFRHIAAGQDRSIQGTNAKTSTGWCIHRRDLDSNSGLPEDDLSEPTPFRRRFRETERVATVLDHFRPESTRCLRVHYQDGGRKALDL
jgi:hypothetical protein